MDHVTRAAVSSAVGHCGCTWALRQLMPLLLRLLPGIGCGLAWGRGTAALAFVPLLFAAWWHARSRLEALAVLTAYHLVAVRPLVVGGSRFFELPVAHSTAIVALGAAVAALPWAFTWCAPGSRISSVASGLRVTTLFVLTAAPPLTTFAVPSPWAAAGVWFPGSGFVGLLALIAVAVGMRTSVASRPALSFGVYVALAMTLSVRYHLTETPRVPDGLSSVNTDFDANRDDALNFLRQWDVAQAAMEAARAQSALITVLPESVGGLWQPSMQRQWAALSEQLYRDGRTALVGVTLSHRNGGLRGGVVSIGTEHGQYVQRAPMPIAMWRPWSTSAERFEPEWFGPSTMRVDGRELGIFVCWEIGVLWTVLQSVWQGADALVVVANTAWARNTSAAQAELQITEAWGALFALPTLVAMNR